MIAAISSYRCQAVRCCHSLHLFSNSRYLGNDLLYYLVLSLMMRWIRILYPLFHIVYSTNGDLLNVVSQSCVLTAVPIVLPKPALRQPHGEPRPCSPARAASAAFKASNSVWLVIWVITRRSANFLRPLSEFLYHVGQIGNPLPQPAAGLHRVQ